jgi:hypothetical protein
MTSGNFAFGQSWGTGSGKCICMSSRKSELSPHATVNMSQYGDPLIRYVADKQGHVSHIHMFILFRFSKGISLNVFLFMF